METNLKKYGIIMLGILALGWFFFRKKDSDPELNDVVVPMQSNKLSMETGNLDALTEQLYSSMANSFGTNEKRIFDTLEKINSSDFVYIYNKFGRRRYFIGGRSWLLGEKMDLVGWLQAELSSREYNRIKDMFPTFKLL